MLKVGDKAPEFKLMNTDKKEISLSDFAGKNVIIHFFPLAFTGTCTTQLCTARDNMNVYKSLNAEVLAISVDSVFSLEEFKKQQNFNFDVLSDFNKTVSAAYDALYEVFPFAAMQGVSKRAAFVVGADGNLKYAEVLASPGDLPNFAAIKAAL
jgi:glutaredoxin-dependent peroxiredoxin